MIILQHNWKTVTAVTYKDATLSVEHPTNIARQLLWLAKTYPNDWLVWCHESVREVLNLDDFPNLLEHQRMMHSFGFDNYLSEAIGFVEDSPFINIKKEVRYPTWRMHGLVGVIHAKVLQLTTPLLKPDKDFSYYLNSVAKLLMPQGLFCYSTPQLLQIQNWSVTEPVASTRMVFKFVKQHYKTRWTWFLLVCFMLYNKQLPLGALITALFYKKRQVPTDIMEVIPLKSSFTLQQDISIDVVIPTIGRKAYLYDVLKDLAAQSVLPKKVIVIEQNPDKGSKSELDYLYDEDWPFKIKHLFTHQTGACNARNLGLEKVASNYVFLADDDNRFDSYLLENMKACFKRTGANCITTSYLQKNEVLHNEIEKQWSTFGAGNSFIHMNSLNSIRFNGAYEHGYGEDADFGMQLRNAGVDIIYVPSPTILHLKAPMGGFRTKFKHPWVLDAIQPKPSPTVMLYRLLHQTDIQLRGYKLRLFFNLFKQRKPFKIITFVKDFRKSWANSLKWAAYLKSL